MSEIVHVGACPTCKQPVYRSKMCGCGHSVTAHAFGARKGASVRTYCNVHECVCKVYEEAKPDGQG